MPPPKNYALMKIVSGPAVGDRLPADVAALGVPLPGLIVWLRHVG
jgi:hypothetical protein